MFKFKYLQFLPKISSRLYSVSSKKLSDAKIWNSKIYKYETVLKFKYETLSHFVEIYSNYSDVNL